jgi:hypothetical protein
MKQTLYEFITSFQGRDNFHEVTSNTLTFSAGAEKKIVVSFYSRTSADEIDGSFQTCHTPSDLTENVVSNRTSEIINLIIFEAKDTTFCRRGLDVINWRNEAGECSRSQTIYICYGELTGFYPARDYVDSDQLCRSKDARCSDPESLRPLPHRKYILNDQIAALVVQARKKGRLKMQTPTVVHSFLAVHDLTESLTRLVSILQEHLMIDGQSTTSTPSRNGQPVFDTVGLREILKSQGCASYPYPSIEARNKRESINTGSSCYIHWESFSIESRALINR